MPKQLVFNLSGQVFGRWTVISRVPGNKWLCRCVCGQEKPVYGGSLRNGLSTSCGCYNVAVAHAKRRDLAGLQVGLLTVVDEPRPGYWRCLCACGNEATIQHRALRKRETKSCGCLKCPDDDSLHQKYPRLYALWAGMIQRCSNQNHISFKYYGARGITVCQEWRASFERFFNDMGEPPQAGMSIDRINADGHYTASNCRWATATQQRHNRRSR